MIEIKDAKRRKDYIYKEGGQRINSKGLISALEHGYNYEVLKTLMDNPTVISPDPIPAMDYLTEQFERALVCEPSDTKIKTLNTSLIEAANKFRSANKLKDYFSRKKANISRKVIGNINAAISKIKGAAGAGGIKGNQSKSNVVNKETILTKNKKKADDIIAKRAKLAESCYNSIIEACELNRQYDRVWQTHQKINARFNTKRMFDEACMNPDQCVTEFCTCLDTYDVPFRAKFNICLENILYEYTKNHKSVDKSNLASLITEYFLYNGSVYTDTAIREETSNHAIMQKMISVGKRLSKNSNVAISELGNMVVKCFLEIKANGKAGVIKLADIATKAIGVLLIIVGIGSIGVGVIALIVSLILGVLLICAGANMYVAFDDDQQNKIRKAMETVKNGKVKKELKKVDAAIALHRQKNINTAIKEDYIDSLYQSDREDMIHVLNTNKYYSAEEVSEALSLLNTEFKEQNLNLQLEDMLFGLNEDVYTINESKAKQVMANLRNMSNKSANVIKAQIKLLFTDSPTNIIEEVPNIFKLLFHVIVIAGAFSLSVGLGIIAAMTMWFLSMHVSRKEAKKYISKYKAERDRAKKRQNTIKDPKAKERNEAYIKKLDEDIRKLEDYESDLYTDKEKEEREDSSSSLDDDLDFGLDKDLKESACKIAELDYLVSVYENFNTANLANIMNLNVKDIQCDMRYEALMENAIKCSMLNTKNMHDMCDAISEEYAHKSTRKWDFARRLNNTIRYSSNHQYDDIRQVAESCEVMNAIINEMNIVNQITMLKDSISRKAKDLSDKEKIASGTLDNSIEQMRQGMARSLKQENKEAVIRGTICPSASRIIKLALMSGLTFLINPALTVIYLLGVFALSKDIRAKERQIVYDELDTELKVVEQYIQEAKEKKDMNAYRNCLNLQKKLLRQRDRIKYAMNVKYNEDIPDSVKAVSAGKSDD